MPECLVNNVPAHPNPGLQTWGDLLADLDGQLARDRRIVTAARFDGVDQPSFRAAPVAARSLTSVELIEVEASEALVLIDETLAMARESLPVLAASARQAADTFRRGELTSAQHHLTALVEAVQTLMVLTGAAATAAAVDLTSANPRANLNGPDVFASMTTALDAIVAKQIEQDWSGVAAALDGPFATTVTEWTSVLDAIAAGGRA